MITRTMVKQIKSMKREELDKFLDQSYKRGVRAGLKASVSNISIDQENIDEFNDKVSKILNEEFKIGPTRYARVKPALEKVFSDMVYQLISTADVRMESDD